MNSGWVVEYQIKGDRDRVPTGETVAKGNGSSLWSPPFVFREVFPAQSPRSASARRIGSCEWETASLQSEPFDLHRKNCNLKTGEIQMLKKMVLAGSAAALLSGVTLGVPLWSYARCGTNWVKDTANNAMPLEWELKRARQMIADLKPEVTKNARRIAREKVELARLHDQLDQANTQLAKSEADIQRLRGDLENQKDYYTYAGRTYTSVQVKSDLGNRFKRYKTRQATAEKLNQMLAAREHSLQAAHQQMDAMLNARRQLEVEVENLQARLGSLRVAQTSSDLNLDDSQLAQTRELLDKIATGIDMAEETMIVDGEYFGEIDLDANQDEDLLDEITAYFDSPSGTDSADAQRQALVSIQID